MLLAVQAKTRRLALLAQRDVMERLRQHRLHELLSTGGGAPWPPAAAVLPLASGPPWPALPGQRPPAPRCLASSRPAPPLPALPAFNPLTHTPSHAPAGLPLEHFAEFQPLDEGAAAPVASTGLHLRCVRSQHSELCYGFVLYHSSCSSAGASSSAGSGAAGEGSGGLVPLLGWSADSGCCELLYAQLAEAPVLLLDARRQASREHAGFEQVAELLAEQGRRSRRGEVAAAPAAACKPAAAAAQGGGAGSGARGCGTLVAERAPPAAATTAAAGPGGPWGGVSHVFITGYGRQEEAPSEEWVQQQARAGGMRLRVAQPGHMIQLWPTVICP